MSKKVLSMIKIGEGERTGSRFACCLFFISWLILTCFLRQFPDDVKGRFENRLDLSITKIRVRKNKLYQLGPLRLVLALKECIGIAGNLDEPDPLFDIVLCHQHLDAVDGHGLKARLSS
jgi:hypothetical protein